MVQRRAARYVKNRYHNTSSATEIIGQLQWISLEERRKAARLILLYKISNGLVKIDAADNTKTI
jgi:16S rRNA C1402 (ribose-2'-O) methylase RsmI